MTRVSLRRYAAAIVFAALFAYLGLHASVLASEAVPALITIPALTCLASGTVLELSSEALRVGIWATGYLALMLTSVATGALVALFVHFHHFVAIAVFCATVVLVLLDWERTGGSLWWALTYPQVWLYLSCAVLSCMVVVRSRSKRGA